MYNRLLSCIFFSFLSLLSTLHYTTPNQCSGSKHGEANGTNGTKRSSTDDSNVLRKEMEEQKERADGYLVQLQDGAKYVQTMREQLEEVCTDVLLHIMIYYSHC